MSYRVANLLPVRRLRRKMERRHLGVPRMRSAPLLERPQRVVIRSAPGTDEGEELLLLAALQELKRLHDRIDLVYCTEHESLFTMVKRAWFLKDCYQYSVQSFFEQIVGDDFSITAFEPDPEAAHIAEEERYKVSYNKEVETKTALQQKYQEEGMKDLVVDLPVYNFVPQWHKSNAYLWLLSDRLGLQVQIPFTPLTPYGSLPALLQERQTARAARGHLLDRPFGVYDLCQEPDEIVLQGAIGRALDPLTLLSLQAIQKEVGTGIDALLAVLRSSQCRFVAAPVGPLLYAAWAAGVPSILTLYTGANPRWDGVCPGEPLYEGRKVRRSQRIFHNGFPLYRDQYDDEKLIAGVYQAALYLKERLNELRS